ncbi:LptA/OstA family protein [Agrobacterium sp. ES01]|uniref:LptA/OstA family protein n=1 Tax=Agrobacterium sp. ES01 TaxID=3420714 RepID=UPI003D11136C
MSLHHHAFVRFSSAMIAAALAASTLTMPVMAQTTNMEGMKLSNDQPIQIESDELQFREQDKQAIFTGNVKVVQGSTMLRAGRMIVHYKGEGASVTAGNADIEKIDVSDTVFLSSGAQQATAETGNFNLESQVFVLQGDRVVLSEGQNVFVGCKLTVKMTNGEAKLESCGGRVQIQLDPKSQQKKK